MNIFNATCSHCRSSLQLEKARCGGCGQVLEGQWDLPALARLELDEQVFVAAFLRHHGSIRKMEQLFSVSYPTIKNRLNRIIERLDSEFKVPTPNQLILERLARGEITVDQALAMLN
ncbi:MAG: DUF2089 domain-containing protein [Calditrichaeota bacterium]|nr:DUF2089 domain-containing protein [Candidatus Cloacimonadota bacterium]MCA9786545.1 DUF2089 domain-containing protein [Candidatus Cloacimonadota bacterium]MCB1048126.1 DUF2089 domain-containing protein [Calditrichota bacterium]MCB9475117.1 DUF2089 domain-containing protein [Candidatus Delongbacteria bacterium]